MVITRAGRLPDHEWLQGGASAVFRSVSVSWEAGKVKVKDTMDGFFGALVSMTSPSWIQLFISVLGCPVTLCIFNSIPYISFVSESKNKLYHLCLILRY